MKSSLKRINHEWKMRANFFMFNLGDFVKRESGHLNAVRELSKKYIYKKDLVNDLIYKLLKAQGVILDVRASHNLVPTVGRAVFAERLSGGTTYTGAIDWGAFGSGTTPFSNASTQLNTEVYRKQADSREFDENITYIDWFVASGDIADQTFEEFAAFIDASITPNSGQAFSLQITGGWIKSGSIFISAKYTLS